jgi:hypothetical protein
VADLDLEQTHHGEPCYYCGKPTNDLAGNPAEWSVVLSHADEPGVAKAHHAGCVNERLERLREAEAERDALRVQVNAADAANALGGLVGVSAHDLHIDMERRLAERAIAAEARASALSAREATLVAALNEVSEIAAADVVYTSTSRMDMVLKIIRAALTSIAQPQAAERTTTVETALAKRVSATTGMYRESVIVGFNTQGEAKAFLDALSQPDEKEHGR